jgi:KDO2-lipid IV(A) lauroyltransferase
MRRSGMNLRKWIMNRIAVPVLRRMPIDQATNFVEGIGRWEYDRIPELRRSIDDAVATAAERMGADWDLPTTSRNLSGRLTRWRLRDVLLDGPDARRALDAFEVVGGDHLEQAIAEQRGVVLLSNHFGGHILPAHWMLRRNLEFRFLTERPRHLSRSLESYFGTTGPMGQQEMFVSRKKKGNDGVASIIRSLRVIKSKYIMLVASDVRWLDNQSVGAQFLGERWKFTPIWAILAQRSGAPVVSVYCSMLPGGTHRLEFAEPRHIEPGDDISRNVQEELSRIESRVLKDPENANDYFFWALDKSPAADELRVAEPDATISKLIPSPHFGVETPRVRS